MTEVNETVNESPVEPPTEAARIEFSHDVMADEHHFALLAATKNRLGINSVKELRELSGIVFAGEEFWPKYEAFVRGAVEADETVVPDIDASMHTYLDALYAARAKARKWVNRGVDISAWFGIPQDPTKIEAQYDKLLGKRKERLIGKLAAGKLIAK